MRIVSEPVTLAPRVIILLLPGVIYLICSGGSYRNPATMTDRDDDRR